MKLFKSRKTYYLYNPNTLNYERVYPSAKDRFFIVLRHLSIGIAIGVGIFFIMVYAVESPRESLMQKENKLLQTQYEVLSLRLNEALSVLNDIQLRDENLYRAIFQTESIPESVRKAGFGGTNRYEHLLTLSNPDLVVSTTQKMDMLSKQLYIQSNSLEELIHLGKNQEERLKCIPAIQPISNKDLRQTASGYGMRIDPIYRTPRFHSGMDFSAKKGSRVHCLPLQPDKRELFGHAVRAVQLHDAAAAQVCGRFFGRLRECLWLRAVLYLHRLAGRAGAAAGVAGIQGQNSL